MKEIRKGILSETGNKTASIISIDEVIKKKAEQLINEVQLNKDINAKPRSARAIQRQQFQLYLVQ